MGFQPSLLYHKGTELLALQILLDGNCHNALQLTALVETDGNPTTSEGLQVAS